MNSRLKFEIGKKKKTESLRIAKVNKYSFFLWLTFRESSLSSLPQHMYVSLSEIQIKEEEEAMNRPFTKVTCFTSFVKWINDLSLLVIKSIHIQRPLFRWYAFVHLATTVHVFPRLAPVACFPALCVGYMFSRAFSLVAVAFTLTCLSSLGTGNDREQNLCLSWLRSDWCDWKLP